MYEGRTSGEGHVKLSVYSVPDLARPTFEEATSQEFKPTKVGESFGPSWSTHWFKVQLTVPQDLRKKEHLELHWDANNEGLIWTQDGEPLQGLTGGGERVEWTLPKDFRDGKEHIFYIEMACNSMFGNPRGGDIIQPPDPDRYFQLRTADIVAVNLEARALFVDFWIIGGKTREHIAKLPTKALNRCRSRVSWRLMGISRSFASCKCHHGCFHRRTRQSKINR